MNCESCIHQRREQALEKEIEKLQSKLNELAVHYNHKLLVILFLKDKLDELEKE